MVMKKRNYVSVLLLSFTVGLVSCDKGDPLEPVAAPESSISIEQMANARNPEDGTGRIHNAYLDYFAGQVKAGDGVDREKLMAVTQDFYRQQDEAFNEPEQYRLQSLLGRYAELTNGHPRALAALNICDIIPSLCNTPPGSPGPYNPFPIVSLLTGTGDGTATSGVFEFIRRIKSMEADLINSRAVKEEDRRVLLQAYAVARYSAAYWHNATHGMAKHALRESLAELTPAELSDVVAADIAGAIVGGSAGSAGGPIGTVIGAGVGAGVASAYAVFNKWKWSW